MKFMIYVGACIGGIVGGYIPVLFGDDNILSSWSLICGVIGTLVGVWAGYKVGQYFEV